MSSTHQSELARRVDRDVKAYIDALRGCDPRGKDKSYQRLHGHLSKLVYEMRLSEERLAAQQNGRTSVSPRRARSSA